MLKRLISVATLSALAAMGILVGQAFADTDYAYQPSTALQCSGAIPYEVMRSSFLNQTGNTIHVKRWYILASAPTTKVLVDSSFFALWDGGSDAESYRRKWPIDLLAIGWTTQEGSLSGISIANQGDVCRY